MASTQNLKFTIAKETLAGTPIGLPGSLGWTNNAVAVPVKGLGTLDNKVERKVDEIILGTSAEAGAYDVSSNTGGNIQLSPRACAGYGHLFKGNLGNELLLAGSPPQIGGVLRIMYNGASASCKFGVTATTLTSAVGVAGAEVADAAFGTTGVLTLASYTTLEDLHAAINYSSTGPVGFVGYKADIVMGLGTASTTTPLTFTSAQAAGKYVYVYFQSTTSGMYLHQLTPDLSQTERPSFSIEKEIAGIDGLLYTGCYVNDMSLAATLKGQATGEVVLLGFTEAIGQSPSGIPQPTSQALIFQNGNFTLAGASFTYVRNVSFKSTNTMFADGYGMGSLDRQYVTKGKFAVTGDFQLRLDPTSYAERAKVFQNGKNAPLSVYFRGGINTVTGMQEALILEMPYLQYMAAEPVDNGGMLDIKITYQAFNPGGPGMYDPMLSVSFISSDSASY